MMLNLPDVTLIMVETRAHEIAQIALNDCLSKITFGDVIVYSDQPDRVTAPGVRHFTVPNWPNKQLQGEFYYSDAAQLATTSHVLMMEWDGGVRDVSMWRDEFLTYDYIGAPWVGMSIKPEYLVGNGGFTLMSRRLASVVHAHKNRFHICTDVELSRDHREFFEGAIGAKWAPRDVALRFSYEQGGVRRDAAPSFGYHDIFNWPLALSREEVLQRARLVASNPYTSRTSKLTLLCRDWPWVGVALGIPPTPARPPFRRPFPIQRRLGQKA